MIDLKNLRECAEEAASLSLSWREAWTDQPGLPPDLVVAFIAAFNPQTALALLDMVERYERMALEMREALEWYATPSNYKTVHTSEGTMVEAIKVKGCFGNDVAAECLAKWGVND